MNLNTTDGRRNSVGTAEKLVEFVAMVVFLGIYTQQCSKG
jgi:hypothetical protein